MPAAEAVMKALRLMGGRNSAALMVQKIGECEFLRTQSRVLTGIPWERWRLAGAFENSQSTPASGQRSQQPLAKVPFPPTIAA